MRKDKPQPAEGENRVREGKSGSAMGTGAASTVGTTHGTMESEGKPDGAGRGGPRSTSRPKAD